MLTLAAARPAWGAEDSNGDSHLCLERGSEMRMVASATGKRWVALV